MFGALNRFIARLDADPQTQQTNNGLHGQYGFQVVKNSNSELAIEPWFDFVIGINGRNIESGDPTLFATEVKNCAGNAVNLGLWSAKGQRIRQLYCPLPSQSPLGLSLHWNPLTTAENVWHILEVTANSPASTAGLLPYSDYIVGTPDALVTGESGLGELVEEYLARDLRLFVYNHEYDVVRLVTIQPSRTWGGQGALGCVLGYGALHRIPAPLEEPPQGPGETLFETARLSTDGEVARPTSSDSGTLQHSTPAIEAPPPTSTPQYLVPANMDVPASGAGPTKGTPRKGRKQHAAVATDMDAYFQEGEEKSREQEGGSTPKPGGAAAPPPKGGPPQGGPPKDLAASPSKDGGEAA